MKVIGTCEYKYLVECKFCSICPQFTFVRAVMTTFNMEPDLQAIYLVVHYYCQNWSAWVLRQIQCHIYTL